MGLTLVTLVGCSTTPPQNPDNICSIFEEKRSWYKSAQRMNEKWGVPIQVPMAMMYQESTFKHDAKPPKKYVLGFIPWGRVSSAYGYSQAKTPTWEDYIRETGRRGADRDDFDDAIDFMGWFISKTHKVNGVSKWDARLQYLNYHEGWGGFRRKTYNSKPWLLDVSKKVGNRASRYSAQYKACKADLDRGWFSRMLFG